MSLAYPRYTVNGRICTSYEDANLYWQVYGGIMMCKLDDWTPAYVLQSRPVTSRLCADLMQLQQGENEQ